MKNWEDLYWSFWLVFAAVYIAIDVVKEILYHRRLNKELKHLLSKKNPTLKDNIDLTLLQ